MLTSATTKTTPTSISQHFQFLLVERPILLEMCRFEPVLVLLVLVLLALGLPMVLMLALLLGAVGADSMCSQ